MADPTHIQPGMILSYKGMHIKIVEEILLLDVQTNNHNSTIMYLYLDQDGKVQEHFTHISWLKKTAWTNAGWRFL